MKFISKFKDKGRQIIRGPLFFCFVFGFFSFAHAEVVFNQVPASLALSYSSWGFQAKGTRALGNYIQLAGKERWLSGVTVTLVTQAKQADFSTSTNPAGWIHPLEIILYSVDRSGPAPDLYYITGKIQDVLIPWRPVTTPPGYPQTEGSAYPYQGYAFNVFFSFNAGVQIPNELVVVLAFDTSSYGYVPVGATGPYDSLNVAIGLSAVTAGADLDPVMFYSSRMVNGDYESTLNTSVSGGGSPFFKIEALDAYGAWISTYGLTPGGPGSLRSDDPDRDGWNNLTEFSFGTDPTVGTPSPLTLAMSNQTLTLTWLQRKDGSVCYTNRSTTNLLAGFPPGSSTNFVAMPATNTNNLLRPEYMRYQFSTNVAGVARRFYRVDAGEVP